MTWEECIKLGYAAKSFRDVQRAKSLIKMSDERVKFVETANEKGNKAIFFGEMYEALLQVCQALACLEGYKIDNHECITHFLGQTGLRSISIKFDRFRFVRNGMNYYGNIPADNFSAWAIKESDDMIRRIRRLIQEKHGI